MIVALIILFSILTIFLDSFFVALAGFRILPVIVIAIYSKVNWKYIALFSILSSLLLDVVYHYVLGTNLLILAIILFLGRIVSIFVPFGSNIGSYALKYLGFILYYILLALIPSLIGNGTWGILTWSIIGLACLKSLFTIGICFVFDIVLSNVRSKDNSTKLKLG